MHAPSQDPDFRHGATPSTRAPEELLLPMVRDLHAAVGDLRRRLDAEFAEIRSRIDGRMKSHYTVDEVAELTGRAPYTVRTWIKSGLIQATRVSGTGPKGRLLVPREELRKLVDDGRGGSLTEIAIG